VTKASFLPADPAQEPLISKMHNKVTLIPTLSIIAEKKPDEAKEILAILERIYDGEYRRGTAKGARGEIVDTVIIGALTTEVFENTFLRKMLAYGSRYLIYRYTISSSIALAIADMLSAPEFSRLLQSFRSLASFLFTYAMDNVNATKLNSVVLTEEQRRDLEVLAELLAKLRFVFHRRIEYEEEEVDGKKSKVQYEVLEITQTDVPIRSYIQLLNVVRANSIIRKVPRFLGYPQVDDHAMTLAAKLALTSSHRIAHDIIVYLMKNHDTVATVNDVAKYVNTSRSTVYRYLDILQAVGVVTDTANPRLEEKYYKVLSKYLLKEGVEV
jgi:DNA-binding transcriptional ArsR family regulator